MKTIKQKKNKKFLYVGVIVVVLLVASASAYAFILPTFNQASPEKQLTQEASDAKKDYIENTDENGQPVSPASETPQNDVSFTLSDDGSSVVVIAKIVGLSEGTCTIEVGDFSASAPILYQPEYSTCEGFSISKTDVGTNSEFILTVSSEDTNIIVKRTLNE